MEQHMTSFRIHPTKLTAIAIFAILMTTSGVPLFADEAISDEVRDVVLKSDSKDWAGIGLGPDNAWRLRPGFEFRSAWDSNVFRETAGNRNEEIIFDYAPQIAIKRQGTRFSVYSDYELTYESYFRNENQSNFQHRTNNEVKFTGERLNVTASDRFAYLNGHASSELTDLNKFSTNDIHAEAIYKLTPKVSVSALFNNNLLHFLEDSLQAFSYSHYQYGGRVYYHITEKTDVYVQGSGHVTDYYESNLYDSGGADVLAGARGKLTEKIGFDVNTGYKGQDYEPDYVDDYHAWVFEGALKYDITQRSSFSATILKDVQESTYQNVGYYEVLGGDLAYHYQVTPLLESVLTVGYQDNDYPTETTQGTETKERNDDITSTGLRFIYGPFHNVSIEAGYSFRTRQSNFENFEYVDHYLDSILSYKFG